jgi:hypothetical protein
MNKPILLTVTISVAAAVGFIFGVMFEDYHGKELVTETIGKHSDVQKLFGWYERAFVKTLVLKDLDSIQTLEDVETIKQEYRRNGASDVSLFRKQVEKMKKDGANHAALAELEAAITKLEQEYGLRLP